MADVTVTAGDVRPVGDVTIERVTAGGSVNIGDAVYLNSSGQAIQCTAATASITTAMFYGIAVATPDGSGGTVVASGQHLDVVTRGCVCGFSSLAEGIHHWVSATAGKIADAQAGSGYFNYIVGIPRTTTIMDVRPMCESIAAQS